MFNKSQDFAGIIGVGLSLPNLKREFDSLCPLQIHGEQMLEGILQYLTEDYTPSQLEFYKEFEREMILGMEEEIDKLIPGLPKVDVENIAFFK